jgi:hypothetical protein
MEEVIIEDQETEPVRGPEEVVLYLLETGEIRAVIRPSPTVGPYIPEGFGCVVGSEDGSNHYVLDEEIVLRPRIEPEFDEETGVVTVYPCPEGSVAKVKDKETGVLFGEVSPEEGSMMIELEDPGEYRIEFDLPFPWMKAEPFDVVIEDEQNIPEQ